MEVKNAIKKHEKLMKGISNQLSALQEALDSISIIEEVRLVIGGSLVRPLYVYSMRFAVGKFGSSTSREGVVSKVAQTLSKKVGFLHVKRNWFMDNFQFMFVKANCGRLLKIVLN